MSYPTIYHAYTTRMNLPKLIITNQTQKSFKLCLSPTRCHLINL